jgi:hypothetical protein
MASDDTYNVGTCYLRRYAYATDGQKLPAIPRMLSVPEEMAANGWIACSRERCRYPCTPSYTS